MTEKLYLTDSYMIEFEARVLDVVERAEGSAVVLDQTCFYPEGGGQPCDLGRLNDAAVLKVAEEKGAVYHFVDRLSVSKGEKLAGRIDWERRFDHMQQHTGQHLLSQAFLRTLGCETVSFHLGGESSTIDLEVESLTPEAIYGAEDTANGIIYQNRQTKCYSVEEESLGELPLRGASPRNDKWRVVEIGDFDYSLCGGTHCRTAGEVGIVKVRRWERSKGRARVEFFCGRRALKDYRAKNRWLFEISRELGVSESEAGERLRRQLEENKELRRKLNRATEVMLEMEAGSLAAGAKEIKRVKVIARVFHDREVNEVKQLAAKLTAKENCAALFGVARDTATVIFSCSQGLGLDMGNLMASAAELVGGKGGGKPTLAQGGGPRVDRLQEAIDKAEESVTKFIEA